MGGFAMAEYLGRDGAVRIGTDGGAYGPSMGAAIIRAMTLKMWTAAKGGGHGRRVASQTAKLSWLATRGRFDRVLRRTNLPMTIRWMGRTRRRKVCGSGSRAAGGPCSACLAPAPLARRSGSISSRWKPTLRRLISRPHRRFRRNCTEAALTVVGSETAHGARRAKCDYLKDKRYASPSARLAPYERGPALLLYHVNKVPKIMNVMTNPHAAPACRLSMDALREQYPPPSDLYAWQGQVRTPAPMTGAWLSAIRVRDLIVESWFAATRRTYEQQGKRVYYLSMEFLIGRILEDAVINLGLHQQIEDVLQEDGMSLIDVVEDEPDAALGNGGLGRLAACFLESMSTLGCPAFGYGIRYEHGLFRQRFEGGRQVETPEDWLNQTHPWEFERPEAHYTIPFKGRVEMVEGRAIWRATETVLARAYDTPVVGWQGRWSNTLRLWGALPTEMFDLERFNAGDFTAAAAPEALGAHA